ncbi:MAG TPA: hypothetical protein VIK58_12605 [Caldimonas sp.]
MVALDRADRNLAPMTPEAYREAARRALKMTREEMGLLPIGDFAGPVNSLQTFAENIFFGINGCFADLDGSGRAPVAVPLTRELIDRLSSISIASVDEISNSLFARLRAPNRGTGRRRLAAR